jgi:hypothetical protein
MHHHVLYLPRSYLPIYLYMRPIFLQNWLPRWKPNINSVEEVHPQLSYTVPGIQCMVRWWVLVHIGSIDIVTCIVTQNRRFHGKMEWKPFGPPIYVRRGGIWPWAKHMGLKLGDYWEHPWGTHWGPDGNPLRTWREHRVKMKKIPPPTQNLKRK